MSPKIVNGSFAAIYDQGDVLADFSRTIKLRQNAQDSPGTVIESSFMKINAYVVDVTENIGRNVLRDIFLAMRRRIRGILMSGKQFSLDSRLDLFHGIESPIEQEPAEATANLPVLEDTEEKSSSPSGC